MAFDSNLETRSEVAAADLSAKQFRTVLLASTGVNISAAGKNITGILQNSPASGQMATYAIRGRTKAAISASQTITKGGQLEVDTGGTLIPLASGIAVAVACESLVSVAAVRLIAVEITLGVGLYA